MKSYLSHVRNKHNGIPLPETPKIEFSKNN